ncbi:MAG: UDP-4-amino-4,6-dideoxy-N-acetyl-beta-L-altrosamine transaminase [Rhodospirillaceae bacterium]|nr:UDP-4-amino-4,6-dideoxy-N-acetyl-beta-L-altrosamine transaminase [Rhodospirillaceae bacterium]
MTNPPMLPYGRHVIDDDDVAAVAAVLKSPALTGGPAVDQFERALAEATGAADAVACSSGTSALHLAVLGLGLKPGDQVVAPSLTFLATANCARYVGADVVFADVDPSTGLMTPDTFRDAIARGAPGRVKAAIPVHLNGQACDMRGLRDVAATHGIALVEDACHALGTTYPGNDTVPVGACRDSVAACFSFHPVKTVAMGEGGAVTTNDPVLAATMRRLRGHGMERNPEHSSVPEFALAPDGSPNPWFYEMNEVGWNYRASDIHCALGSSQLKKLPQFLRRRQELVALYDAALKPLAPLVRPLARTGGTVGWHLYVVLIDFAAAGKGRAALMRALSARGIGTQVHYFPVHLQPYYQRLYGRHTLPGAESYYRRCLSLPLFPAMSDTDVGRVAEALGQVLRQG